MLSTEILVFSAVFFALIVVSLLSLRLRNLESRVASALAYMETNNKRALSLKKMADVEASLTELTDAYDALLASHKKMRSRIGMRAVRDQRQADKEAVPDPTKDPAGYKQAMRLKLHTNKM